MPRTARVDYPGALHHVMLRGIERRQIFVDDGDRTRFLQRVEESLEPSGMRCFAWALMPNHVHLLLATGTSPLASFMHRVGTCHAMDFNRRHDRVGHLFQNRYKSLAVENDAYLLQAARYIHLNPLKAGLVESVAALEVHPWTGHSELMGRCGRRIIAADFLLGMLDDDPTVARDRLRAWMAAGVGGAGGGGHEAGGNGEPPGDDPAADLATEDSAVPAVLRGTMVPPSTDRDSPPRIRETRLRREGWDLDRLLEWTCRRMGVPVDAVESGRRTRTASRARAVAAWLAWEGLGIPQAVLAGRLGVGGSALPGCLERGRRLVAEEDLRPFPEAGGDRPPLPVPTRGEVIHRLVSF